MRFISDIFIFCIRLYQIFISPYTGRNCRFYPTCSSYSIDAIRERGLFIGCFLSVKRIIRCNPFVKIGYDPVTKVVERRS